MYFFVSCFQGSYFTDMTICKKAAKPVDQILILDYKYFAGGFHCARQLRRFGQILTLKALRKKVFS
jgi:hypothetical protein